MNVELVTLSELTQPADPGRLSLGVPRMQGGRAGVTMTWDGMGQPPGKGLPTSPHPRCRATTVRYRCCGVWEGVGSGD